MSELNEFSRAELLLGKKGIEKLRKARVAVFGIGGVGSFCGRGTGKRRRGTPCPCGWRCGKPDKYQPSADCNAENDWQKENVCHGRANS